MEESGQALAEEQESMRLLLPALRAQSLGKRRWCGHCWKLTPDRNLPMCMRCWQYGYCCDEEGESNVVCQTRHWKRGGHREECITLTAAAATIATVAGTVVEVEVGGGDDSKEESAGAGEEDGAGEGGGGGGQKKKKTGGKKKGKKGKKGRR